MCLNGKVRGVQWEGPLAGVGSCGQSPGPPRTLEGSPPCWGAASEDPRGRLSGLPGPGHPEWRWREPQWLRGPTGSAASTKGQSPPSPRHFPGAALAAGGSSVLLRQRFAGGTRAAPPRAFLVGMQCCDIRGKWVSLARGRGEHEEDTQASSVRIPDRSTSHQDAQNLRRDLRDRSLAGCGELCTELPGASPPRGAKATNTLPSRGSRDRAAQQGRARLWPARRATLGRDGIHPTPSDTRACSYLLSFAHVPTHATLSHVFPRSAKSDPRHPRDLQAREPENQQTQRKLQESSKRRP